jgi:hypothetical protein
VYVLGVPLTAIAVPFAEPIENLELAYVARFGQGCLDYLQHVRSGTLALAGGQDSFVALAYADQTPSLVAALTALLSNRTFDALLAAPSTRSLHLPYFAALRSKHPGAIDVTSNLTRAPGVHSGPGSGLAALVAAMSFSPPGAKGARSRCPHRR